MISRLVLAVVVGVVVTLVCLLVGALLMPVDIAWVVAIAVFLKTFAGLLGLLATLWFFFSGGGHFGKL